MKANLEQRITTQNMEDYIFAVEVPDEYVMGTAAFSTKKRAPRASPDTRSSAWTNEASYRVVKGIAVTGGRPAAPCRSRSTRSSCLTPNVLEGSRRDRQGSSAHPRSRQTQFESKDRHRHRRTFRV